MTVLLTGGAGFIGSHCYYELKDQGYEVVVIDNLSTGNRSLLPEDALFYHACISDSEVLEQIFSKHKIEVVMHFAGSLIVEESVFQPEKYFRNNVVNGLKFMEFCLSKNMKKLIFSSTASVYGNNEKQVVSEEEPFSPENPYATSKMMFEQIMQAFKVSHGLEYIILRYFNVAGADKSLRTGQVIKKPTHLIKLAIQTAIGLRESISIFGTDYPSPDGTCVRDYIHVSDLASAHVSSLKYLLANPGSSEVFNCGNGKGYSVREVLSAVEKVTEKKLNIIEAPRRAGDPVALIADSKKIKSLTGWEPKQADLKLMISSALNWEKKLGAKNI